MKVRDLICLGFELKAGEKGLDKEIDGVYCSDLLSWVMGHAGQRNIWITVQTHLNIIAVASLLEISCIIIPESIEIDRDTLIKADEEGIPILSTNLKTYDIFKKLYEAGIR